MSWGGRDWDLGRFKPIPPIYGSGIPLSTVEANVWVVTCPHCNGPLKMPSSIYPGPQTTHPAIAPGQETTWLAKLYANALLAAWHAIGQMEATIQTIGHVTASRPTIACAARAAYTDALGQRRAVYYIAGPNVNKALHSILPLEDSVTSKLTIDQFEKIGIYLLSPGLPRPSALNSDARVVFSHDVLDRWGGPRQVVQKLFLAQGGSSWLDTAEDMEDRKLNAKYYNPNSDFDTDKHFWPLGCTEQRAVLCHRWVSATPAIRTQLGLPRDAELELEEMAAALIDLHPDKNDPFAMWWSWFDQGRGFPVPPCNTCRIVLPALLCGERAGQPTDPPPGTAIVIPEPTAGGRE